MIKKHPLTFYAVSMVLLESYGQNSIENQEQKHFHINLCNNDSILLNFKWSLTQVIEATDGVTLLCSLDKWLRDR